MGWIALIILGLIAGLIARAILPGKQTSSLLLTLVLGVLGALLGGWIGSEFFDGGLEEFWDLKSWLLAIIGAVIVLAIYGAVFGRGRSRRA
ncbi:GlsB/YeaQ/YmgE family stress response membrane protein [Cellulomonas sp. PhB143]|uniref:GlsB/YeaQ/YmgE family stress response membrane protein n=1 Tax=Cellulomonas sp. PhB143 TaxID=2485186 RepID=UPI000F4A4438|nr:GlsB/YeaQ/YmgE family stress response membrane protein [Cellulomonas sp. PhB143]ROS73325.1 putative membrane protein YeaQ/YmgE (transglycosylase-associated protein family) [Cellulomonas sp. PhB143]